MTIKRIENVLEGSGVVRKPEWPDRWADMKKDLSLTPEEFRRIYIGMDPAKPGSDISVEAEVNTRTGEVVRWRKI